MFSIRAESTLPSVYFTLQYFNHSFEFNYFLSKSAILHRSVFNDIQKVHDSTDDMRFDLEVSQLMSQILEV